MLKEFLGKVIHSHPRRFAKDAAIRVSGPDTMQCGLRRSARCIPSPATVIDVGAAAGTWCEKAEEVWPTARYVLFEPLAERKKELEALARNRSNVSLCFAALGREKSTLQFTVTDDLDGSGFYGKGKLREVDVEALDDVLNRQNLPGPYVLKLDTHGFEVPIFEGAQRTLENAELIIVEVYGFYVAPDSLLLWQICEYLDARGFRLFDVVDTMRRPKDNAFWQADAFFLRKSNVVFTDDTYA